VTDCSLVAISEGFIMLELMLGFSWSHQGPEWLREVLLPFALPVAACY